MFLRIALIFALLGTLASSLNTRSHIDVVDETIDWSYQGPIRTWSGKVEQTFNYKAASSYCRKYTVQKSTPDNKYYAEIGLNYACYCWFSCIDKDTPVFPGDPIEKLIKANGKWCYGKNVKLQIKQDYISGPTIQFTVLQAQSVISRLCTQATACEETCS